MNNDPALDAIPINLLILGISPGDSLILQQLGDYDNGPGGDIYTGLLGVFSMNDSLLAQAEPHRVPGAVDAGIDFITLSTYFGNLPTDIPEDFEIDSILIQVPDSAQYLFLSARDHLFYDNSDPDNDFAINIKIFSVPVQINNNRIETVFKEYKMFPNYPNPFNPTTTITFHLPQNTEVSLRVFNILGDEVATLVSDRLSAGSYSYEWDASNLASGVYLYRLEADGFVETRKMVLMR